MMEADDLLPKTIDIAYTKDKASQNLSIGDTDFPYAISVQKPNCNEIWYVLPSKESVQKFGITPSFSVVRVIDTDAVAEDVETQTAFGSTQTIHMSQDNLYLANPLYTSYAFSCPFNARCLLPRYGGGEHTLIHKFALGGGDVTYQTSTIVQGTPLNQYSMSEDDAGNFRMLTTNRSPEVTTHLFVMDDKLDLAGMIMHIEPGEQFKASRYIGDKLYLVTFEQIDPLFVVDLATPTAPKIIGELEIPGYSTYLHPYADLELGVQYLIGIGYDTTTNQRGGTQNGGIKVDLYKVDYNKKDAKGNVLVSQLWTKTFGDMWSESESLRNPRMFVWHADKKLLLLPMILQKPAGGEDCSIQYDAQGKEISRECYPSYKQTTTFAGLKWITVDVQAGINELFSYDYTSYLKKASDYYPSWENYVDSWFFESLAFRVGYIGEVMFSLNNLFAHFVIPWADEEVYRLFDDNVAEGKVPAYCTYTPPAPGEVTCEMYCGKRWIVEEGNCVEIEITASCSCPGVSTQELCEKECLQ
jgi:hypothetical protein